MKTRNLLLDIVKRPSSCFENIFQNPTSHYRTAVAIFVIAGLVSVFPVIIDMYHWEGTDQNHVVFQSFSIVTKTIFALVQNFVLIGAICWIGKKIGGNANFRNVFTVLAFCLIPTIIGAFVTPTVVELSSRPLFEDFGSTTNLNDELSPSYALDFASRSIVSNVFVILFFGWMLFLLVKATKIVNSFDVKKSIRVVIFAIIMVILSQMILSVMTSALAFSMGLHS